MAPGLTWPKLAVHCTIAALVTAAIAFVAPLVGGGISLRAAFSNAPWQSSYDSPDALIFWGTRVPRVLTALVTGGALALAGLAFQCVLRNPLADPFILGISAGAGMGKAVAVLLWGGFATLAGTLTSSILCFAGAMAPLLLLQSLALRRSRFSPVTLLLAGVMINVVLSAVMMLLQVFAPPDLARQVQLWWLGSLDVTGYRQLAVLAPVVAAAGALLVLRGRAMNVLSFDPATASSLGMDVDREVRTLLWCATLFTSAVVALAGPIGFVGLLVPHVLRLCFGMDNRLLAPLSVFYGAAFLLLCDLVGWRGAGLLALTGWGVPGTVELPVGVVTALLGGPVFLTLLIRDKTSSKSTAVSVV